MRRLLTALIVTALSVLGTPTPAYAAGPTLDLVPATVLVAPGGEPQAMILQGRLSGATAELMRITYTVDFSDVTGFAEVASTDTGDDLQDLGDGDPCTTAGTVITCVVHGGSLVGDHVWLGDLEVTPASAATPGDTGEIVIETTVAGGPARTSRSTVRVGEPVDLQVTDRKVNLAAPAGRDMPLDLQVRNAGSTAVDGVVVGLWGVEGLMHGTHRNCFYSDFVVCVFPVALQPGQAYRLSTPLRARLPGDTAAGSTAVTVNQWISRTEWAELPDDQRGDDGRPGTGGPLRLVPLTGTDAVPQVEIRPWDNLQEVSLSVAGVRPDVVAVGATVAGAAGDTVSVRVGLQNKGPGTLRPPLFSNNAYLVRVKLPGRLRVVQEPEECFPTGEDNLCKIFYERLRPGESKLVTFTTRVAGGTGDGWVKLEAWDEQPLEYGRDLANNTAAIRVAEPGGGAGLPVTGGGAAVLGLLLLAAGTLLRTVVRRA